MAVQILALQQRATANDANGNPLAGAKIYTYQTGTTTPLATYTTSALSTLNANPIEADAAGRFGPIYTNGAVAVKVVIETAAGATVDTLDPAPFVYDSQSAASSISFTPNATLTGDDVQEALDQVTTLLTAGSTNYATVGGTANAITLTTGRGLTSVPTGFEVLWLPSANNTTATTINLDGTGAVTNTAPNGAATVADYFRTGSYVKSIYTGSAWRSFIAEHSGITGNERWTRFPDGTQINRINGSFSGANPVTWTFAKPFSSSPINGVNITIQSTTNARVGNFGNVSTTAVDLYGYTILGAVISDGYSAQVTGRWY